MLEERLRVRVQTHLLIDVRPHERQSQVTTRYIKYTEQGWTSVVRILDFPTSPIVGHCLSYCGRAYRMKAFCLKTQTALLRRSFSRQTCYVLEEAQPGR